MELYLISPPEAPFLGLLPDVLEAGVDRFQYRRPGRSDYVADRELGSVVRICRDRPVSLLVNDRVDLAVLHNVDGVHLGETDLPAEDVKEEWPELDVGRTVRVDDYEFPGADHVSLGPVFSPGSKELPVEPCGVDGVEALLDRVDKPLYVIGGLTPERAPRLPEAVRGVAVISSIWEADDPVRATSRWRKVLDQGARFPDD